MTEMTDNPQAFPGRETLTGICYEGMTLRDYFAGQALSGLYSGIEIQKQLVVDSKKKGVAREQYLAEACYRVADAMLKERKKND